MPILFPCRISLPRKGHLIARHIQLVDEPLLIAEDFAFYQRHLPGVFFLLGTGVPAGQGNPNDSDGCPAYATSALHTDTMLFDEQILLKGLDVYKRLLVME